MGGKCKVQLKPPSHDHDIKGSFHIQESSSLISGIFFSLPTYPKLLLNYLFKTKLHKNNFSKQFSIIAISIYLMITICLSLLEIMQVSQSQRTQLSNALHASIQAIEPTLARSLWDLDRLTAKRTLLGFTANLSKYT